MRARKTIRKRPSETGIALLIAIFILLLIGVVAIALIVSSGTETALAGNYRSSTNVYYAAVAGLEEARARLRSSNPNSFNNTSPGFLPPSGTPLAACSPIYVINPAGGETVAPWDPANAYYDSEFNNEFAGVPNCNLPSPSPSTLSVWNRSPLNSLPFPGPYYKWVRINAVTEQSLNLDTSPYDGSIDPTLIYYNGTKLDDQNAGNQVLEITALAVLPNGSQKLLQYLVSPLPINLPPFPAALTLAGSASSNVVGYSAPASNDDFWVKGIDQDCNGSLTGAKFPAIGVFNNADINPIIYGSGSFTGIPSGFRNSNYPGLTNSPDVAVIYSSFPPTLTTPSGLNAVVQVIMQNADAVIPMSSNATQTSFLSSLVSSGTMSATSPLTLVANGNLDLTGWHNTGYGLLLVTGNLNYDPDATWNGIVMVVGQGTVTGSKGGAGALNGAILVANTSGDDSSFGNSYVNFNNGSSMGGSGIRYSSCWIQKSLPSSGYKILSFHEIAQ
jgi:hypothetical protein